MKRYNKLRICLLAICLMLISSISAQVRQIGKVMELNSGGKAISGVGINVISSSDVQPAVSDSDGVFILNFSEKKQGDIIFNFRVTKQNYEVVNNHILRRGWVLTENDTLKIILAPSGTLAQARAKYYNIIDKYQVANYQATINNLKNELASQQITADEYSRRASEAEKALQEAYYQLNTYADRFARINFDDLDSISRVAFDAFERGEVETAIKIFEERHLLDELKSKIALRNQSTESINALTSLLKQEIQIRLMAADKDNIDKIDDIWKQIILADTANVANISEYQSFIKKYNIIRHEGDTLIDNYLKNIFVKED